MSWNKKECNYKGCTNPVWSKGLCKNHIPRKAMKRTSIVDKMQPLQKRNNQRLARYELFMVLLKQRGRKSEVSGDRINGEISSTWFHHIIPKAKFPPGDLDPENIIILTMEEHENVESDMFKYEEINKRRKQLLKKYNLI